MISIISNLPIFPVQEPYNYILFIFSTTVIFLHIQASRSVQCVFMIQFEPVKLYQQLAYINKHNVFLFSFFFILSEW